MRVTEGFHQNDTKSLLLSSAKQFIRHKVHLDFDCLLDFILPFLALANFLHIFIKMSTCHKWALESGGGKLRNKIGYEIDKYTRDIRLRRKVSFRCLIRVLI